VFTELDEELGCDIQKSNLIRSGLISFFGDLSALKKDSTFIRRTSNLTSTDKLLAEIIRSNLPKVKISLKPRLENVQTSLSAYFLPESIKIIDSMISTSEILKNIFQNLEEQGSITSQCALNPKSIIIRASICQILNNLDVLKNNPFLYQRAMTLKSTEKALQKIYQEKFGGSKN